MTVRRLVPVAAAWLVAAMALPAQAQTTDPEPGVASGFTAGSPYSFRPLEPYWSFYALPPAPPRYARFNDSPVFMTSLNYPGVYGAHTYGVTPTAYYDAAPFMTPAAAPGGFSSMRTVSTGAALARNPTTALINVLVPADDAELRFDNTLTTPIGTKREFVTPPLASRGTYMYSVRVNWTADGVQRSRDKTVYVQAGDRLLVDLTTVVGTNEGPSLRTLPPSETGSTLRTRPLP
jgi:uncharacterized protein (TIGR03000 family)